MGKKGEELVLFSLCVILILQHKHDCLKITRALSSQQILWRAIKELFWCLAASTKLSFSTEIYKILLQLCK